MPATWYYEDDPERARLCEAGVYDPLCVLYGGRKSSYGTLPAPTSTTGPGGTTQPVTAPQPGSSPAAGAKAGGSCCGCGGKANGAAAGAGAGGTAPGASPAPGSFCDCLDHLPWWVKVLGLLVLAGMVKT